MEICVVCGKKLKNKKALYGHSASHNKVYLNNIKIKKEKRRCDFLTENKKLCLNCGSQIICGETERIEDFKTRKFCNHTCSATYSNNQRTLKGYSLRGILKKSNCFSCGKEIDVPINSTKKCKCNDCNPRFWNGKKRTKARDKKCKYCGDENCTSNICRRPQMIKTLIKYFGFNKDKIGNKEFFKERDRIINIINEEYWVNGKSLKELMFKFNYIPKIKDDSRNFIKILNKLGIKRRSISNGISLAINQGKVKKSTAIIFPFKSGWHKTWDGKDVFYRSSYELDYMKELDLKKIEYEVENLRISYWDSVKNKERTAIPDFHIIKTNEIVEIKSNWTLGIQNMKDKFEAYKKLGFKPSLILEHNEVDLYSLKN